VVTAPSADTAFKLAILDLRSEPVVLSVPKMKDRYYSIMLSDLTGNAHGYIGTRETGSGAGSYLIASVDWLGEVPPAVKQIYRVPAELVVALARFEIRDHAEFAKSFEKIADKIEIVPYSKFLNPKAKARKSVSPIEKLPPWYEAHSGDAEGFFRTWNFVSQFQHYSKQHKPALESAARIGMVPGEDFSRSAFTDEVWQAIEEGFAEGRALIEEKAARFGTPIDGWNWSPRDISKYGSNYLRQSAGTWKLLFPNWNFETMYPTANFDADGKQLDGAEGHYLVEFSPGRMPPAKAYWTLTVYKKSDGALFENPLGRHYIGSNTSGLGVPGKDGAIRIRVQAESPGSDEESNWLPAPKEPFYMVLRLYSPTDEALAYKARLNPVKRID